MQLAINCTALLRIGLVLGSLALWPRGLVADEQTKTVEFEGVSIQLYWTKASDLRLFWKDPKTQLPYKRFSKIQHAVQANGERIGAIMNGGIFEPGRIPTGLHVEDGKTLRPINLKDGDGNFYLKPNGVFSIDANHQPAIIESAEYAASRKQSQLAIQSGPILLHNNKIHPKFSKTSRHRRDRNGIGVTADGRILLACTTANQKKYVTLYEFASFFRAQGCTDALFLDGDLSELIVNPDGPVHVKNEYAAVIVVVKPKENEKTED